MTRVNMFQKRKSSLWRNTYPGLEDWKLAWKGIGNLRPKTLEIPSWNQGPGRIKNVFSIFDSTPWENDSNMVYMRKALAQVTMKVPQCSILFPLLFCSGREIFSSCLWIWPANDTQCGRQWILDKSCKPEKVAEVFPAKLKMYKSKVAFGKNCVCLIDGRDLKILRWFCGRRYSAGSMYMHWIDI